MPLNFSAAHSSRITKKQHSKIPLLKRSASSPFATCVQRKPIKRSSSKPETVNEEDDLFGDRLEETGIVKSLATELSLRDVAQIIQHTRSHMFDAIPEGGGFNSTRIAEILNFRKTLPPTVTVAHVHALTDSPSKTEKEIVELIRAGIVRRVVVPGRGIGGSSIGDGLVLWRDVETLVSHESGLDQTIAMKFVDYLKANPMAQNVSTRPFSSSDILTLMRAGFLTSSPHLSSSKATYASRASAPSRGPISVASISKAASGSMAAVGGEAAVGDAGGRTGLRRNCSQVAPQPDQNTESEAQQSLQNEESIQLSLPNTGPLLKLLMASRSHMITLIMKPRFREMPLYLLREKWDGGISGDDPAAKAKKYRGEFSGVLPNRTRKWKQFHGLSFNWVLAECLGAGLIEIFETSSVGRAARTI